VLITAEPLMNESREAFPGNVLNLVLDRLEPIGCGEGEVVGGNANPNHRMNRIHFEMGTSMREPKLSIIPIDLREQHLR